VIYAAETYAGAMLEVLANSNIGRLPKYHAWIEILLGEDVSVEEVDVRKVRRWGAPDQRAGRIFGDKWYGEKRSTVLIVSSTVVRVARIIQSFENFGQLRQSRLYGTSDRFDDGPLRNCIVRDSPTFCSTID
jgi:RES domain-containing protein